MADWRRPALATARPKPAIQDVALNVSKVASKSSAGAPALGQLLSFASTSWVSAMSTKAAGHLWAGSERQSHKSRVPVSRRSCVPAIDPLPK